MPIETGAGRSSLGPTWMASKKKAGGHSTIPMMMQHGYLCETDHRAVKHSLIEVHRTDCRAKPDASAATPPSVPSVGATTGLALTEKEVSG